MLIGGEEYSAHVTTLLQRSIFFSQARPCAAEHYAESWLCGQVHRCPSASNSIIHLPRPGGTVRACRGIDREVPNKQFRNYSNEKETTR